MKRLTLLVLLAAPVFAQPPGDPPFAELIKNLGSNNYRDRHAATLTLQKRPEAAAALRDLATSSDRELSRRATDILRYLDRYAVREIDTAITEGRVGRALELLGSLPAGEYETETWHAVCAIREVLTDLHIKNGGHAIKRTHSPDSRPRIYLSEPFGKIDPYAYLFFRCRNFHPDNLCQPDAPFSDFKRITGVVAADKVTSIIVGSQTVLAGRDARIEGAADDSVILSGGDVVVDGFLHKSLVIARGKITCKAGSRLDDTRVIAGSTVVFAGKKIAKDCIITENEPNPLGFIRWEDAPKEKAKAKAK